MKSVNLTSSAKSIEKAQQFLAGLLSFNRLLKSTYFLAAGALTTAAIASV